MEVIAYTANGLLIQASVAEVKAIVAAINGKAIDKIEIGQRIPAIDYTGTIAKIKALKDDYNFLRIVEYANKMNNDIINLKVAVEDAVVSLT